MRGLATFLFSAALLWWATEATTAKHFETVYGWSEIDYLFPDAETRAAVMRDRGFAPGAAIPMAMEVDAHSGRVFVSTPKQRPGIPISLGTVSETKNANGEHMLLPYPDYSMHTKSCEGIISAESMSIDECGRLWVVDMGAIYTDGMWLGHSQMCQPKILIFDLKTDNLVKVFKIPEAMTNPESHYSTITVDVGSKENECRDSFAYIADTGDFQMIVYDLAHDDAWVVESNTMFPYPEFGHFHYKGVHFDAMYGIYGMSLSPKYEGVERILYFNTFASGKDSYVETSLLKNKTYFATEPGHDLAYYVYSHFHTYPALRPGGQATMGPIFGGVMFYGCTHESAVYCWNHRTAYAHDNFAQVDRDDDAFGMFSHMKVVTKDDGVPHLYIMTNSFEKFMFGDPVQKNEIHFRVMKAPINKLIEGTTCAESMST